MLLQILFQVSNFTELKIIECTPIKEIFHQISTNIDEATNLKYCANSKMLCLDFETETVIESNWNGIVSYFEQITKKYFLLSSDIYVFTIFFKNAKTTYRDYYDEVNLELIKDKFEYFVTKVYEDEYEFESPHYVLNFWSLKKKGFSAAIQLFEKQLTKYNNDCAYKMPNNDKFSFKKRINACFILNLSFIDYQRFSLENFIQKDAFVCSSSNSRIFYIGISKDKDTILFEDDSDLKYLVQSSECLKTFELRHNEEKNETICLKRFWKYDETSLKVENAIEDVIYLNITNVENCNFEQKIYYQNWFQYYTKLTNIDLSSIDNHFLSSKFIIRSNENYMMSFFINGSYQIVNLQNIDFIHVDVVLTDNKKKISKFDFDFKINYDESKIDNAFFEQDEKMQKKFEHFKIFLENLFNFLSKNKLHNLYSFETYNFFHLKPYFLRKYDQKIQIIDNTTKNKIPFELTYFFKKLFPNQKYIKETYLKMYISKERNNINTIYRNRTDLNEYIFHFECFFEFFYDFFFTHKEEITKYDACNLIEDDNLYIAVIQIDNNKEFAILYGNVIVNNPDFDQLFNYFEKNLQIRYEKTFEEKSISFSDKYFSFIQKFLIYINFYEEITSKLNETNIEIYLDFIENNFDSYFTNGEGSEFWVNLSNNLVNSLVNISFKDKMDLLNDLKEIFINEMRKIIISTRYNIFYIISSCLSKADHDFLDENLEVALNKIL